MIFELGEFVFIIVEYDDDGVFFRVAEIFGQSAVAERHIRAEVEDIERELASLGERPVSEWVGLNVFSLNGIANQIVHLFSLFSFSSALSSSMLTIQSQSSHETRSPWQTPKAYSWHSLFSLGRLSTTILDCIFFPFFWLSSGVPDFGSFFDSFFFASIDAVYFSVRCDATAFGIVTSDEKFVATWITMISMPKWFFL